MWAGQSSSGFRWRPAPNYKDSTVRWSLPPGRAIAWEADKTGPALSRPLPSKALPLGHHKAWVTEYSLTFNPSRSRFGRPPDEDHQKHGGLGTLVGGRANANVKRLILIGAIMRARGAPMVRPFVFPLDLGLLALLGGRWNAPRDARNSDRQRTEETCAQNWTLRVGGY